VHSLEEEEEEEEEGEKKEISTRVFRIVRSSARCKTNFHHVPVHSVPEN